MPTRALLVLALLAGCQDPQNGLTKYNSDPVATITSHADGDAVDEGYAVTLRGTIADANDAASALTATWYAGSDELCAAAPVASDGGTECEAVLGLDDTAIVLEGQDDENATGVARVELVVNATEAPTATIVAPVDGGRFYADVPVTVEAVVGDGEDAPTDLVVAWTDGTGAEIDVDATPDGDGALSGSLALEEGEHTLVLTVTDTTGKTGTASVDFTVGGANTAPSCAITRPADGGSAGIGELVELAGMLTDLDVAADTLVATWSSDLDGTLWTGAPDVAGAVSVSTSALSYGTHTLTLTGRDEAGGTCADTVTFSVGAPPDVAIELPLDGAVVNEGALVSFRAAVSDDGTTPDALAVVWESDRDGVLDASAPDAAGEAGFDTDTLSAGEHVVTVTVTDLDGLWTEASVTLAVNGLPGAPTIAITPSAPAGDDDLVASVVRDAVDPEGDPVTYTWAWTVDGAPTAYTSATVPAAATRRGEVWAVTVTPNDGSGDGTAAATSVTIGNTAPALADVTLSPDPAWEGSTLTCTPGAASDADGDAVGYAYAWTVDGLAVAATGSTLGDTWWGRGDVVACVVTPSDGTSAGAAVTSNAVTIDDSAPTIAAVAITPASPAATDTLTCAASGFADADGDADATRYEWTIGGVSVGTGTTLAGAFVGGDEVVCTATPSDGTLDGASRSASVTVANTPPVLAGVSLTPAAPTEADTLTCTPGVTTDADGTTAFAYTYSWTIGGAVIAATGDTLSGADFDRGDVVRCRVVPNDGVEDGAMVASAAVTVQNTAPVVSAATIAPTSPDTDDTLLVAVTSADADGDAVSYTYAWYVDGAPAGTGATLSGAAFDRDDVVYVVVTPTDGTAAGAAYTAASVTVADSAPVMASVSLTPTSATESSTLTCSPSATDADGDALVYSYTWTVNGATIGATGSTLTGADFEAGDTVACRATANDGTAGGAAMASNTVTIGNSAPTLSSVTLTPTTAYEASTLTCTASGSDADGDAVGFTYAWFVDGAAVAATSSTLTGTSFSKGSTVYCRVTPTDGTTTGTAMSSSTVTISNTAPVVSSVSLTPTTAYEGSTLTCSPTASDADGDAMSYTYAWYVNGSAVAATSSTLTGSYFAKASTVYCRVTPSDGTTTGTAVSSGTVTVSNSAPSAPTVAITPADPEEGLDPIVCEIATSATDADGDALTYTFTWTRNGSSYTGASATSSTSSTVPAAATSDGDVFVCSATASDGSATSSAGTDSVTVVGASYYLGYSTEFSSTANNGMNYLFAESVTVPTAADLYQLGIIGKTANGSYVRMALYTDSGGAPGTLVAYTSSAAVAVGRNELDVAGAPVALSAGTYWLVWTHGTANGRTGYTTSGASSVVTWYTSYSFSSSFPASFGSASSVTGQMHNVYMVVR